MVLVRRIRSRGANIVVEANGEVLFAPQGVVGRWTNRFSHRVSAAAQAAAPTNKRPRWDHYGKPLKATFTSSTTYQPGRMKVYSAIGSTSPHAYYVDQGTGVYAGNGPYEAKVLPPWSRGDASLYEATWRPGGPGTRKVAPVMIRGQKGQFFFDRGLKRGFESMRMRSFQVPGEGKISQALASLPSGLLNFLGNTPADAAFRASLEEWRAWRDEAFSAGKSLNRTPYNAKQKLREAAGARKRALAKMDPNLKAFLSTKAAAERRKKAQIEAIRKQREAKALGKERRAQQEAAIALEGRKRRARAAAVAFAKTQKNITGRSGAWVLGPDGLATGFRVSWTTKNGNHKSRVFPV